MGEYYLTNDLAVNQATYLCACPGEHASSSDQAQPVAQV